MGKKITKIDLEAMADNRHRGHVALAIELEIRSQLLLAEEL